MTSSRDGWLADALLGVLALVLLSVTAGVVSNRVSAKPLPLLMQYRPEIPAGVGEMTALAASRLVASSAPIFVDAREPERYRNGHIDGALDLPAETLELGPPAPELLARLQQASFVILYCDGGECMSSLHVARRLQALGVGRLWIMTDGWPAWRAGGFPWRAGDKP